MIEVLIAHTFKQGINNNINGYTDSRSPFTRQYTYTVKETKPGVYPVHIITEEIYDPRG